MSQPMNDDALDRAIEAAMHHRPAPAPPAGLADLAMARATVLEEADAPAARWLRVRRWTQWANAAAAVVLAVWLLFAVFHLPDQTAGDTTMAEPSQTLTTELTLPTPDEAALSAAVVLASISICWALGRSLAGRPAFGG